MFHGVPKAGTVEDSFIDESLFCISRTDDRPQHGGVPWNYFDVVAYNKLVDRDVGSVMVLVAADVCISSYTLIKCISMDEILIPRVNVNIFIN